MSVPCIAPVQHLLASPERVMYSRERAASVFAQALASDVSTAIIAITKVPMMMMLPTITR
jgi:hypothetical protein